MRPIACSAALLLATAALVVVPPTAAADFVNCPDPGYSGVVVTQPSGNPYGVCCKLGSQPMTCRAYRLDVPPVDELP